jgi:hypothetical protein
VPLATHSITPNNEIVLNVSSTEDVIDVVKSELVDEEEEEESAVDPVVCDASTLIIPWPAFVPVASHPELAGQRRKRKAAAPSAGSAADKRARSRLEDVTDQYVEEETDENQVCTVVSMGYRQGCGSVSAWIRVVFGSWIRIRIRIRVKS